MILPFIVFAGTLCGMLVVYWALVLRPEQATAETLRRRLHTPGAPTSSGPRLLKKDLGTKTAIDDVLARATGFWRPLTEMVEQSGLRMTAGGLLLLCAMFAVIAFLIGALVIRMNLVGLVAAVCAAPLPVFFVRWKRTQRLLKFEEQFPEALDLLARSLRAGHALTTGISLVAEEMPDPIGPEFKLLYDRQNYGMPFPDALRDFGERIPVLDAKFFVTAVLIQRESGGNLSEVLTNLSGVIRERFRVKRQVRVLSAHGRITGWILSGLPPALGFMFLISSEEHMQTLFEDPLGRQMIAVAIVLQILGTLIIRKLVRIEY